MKKSRLVVSLFVLALVASAIFAFGTVAHAGQDQGVVSGTGFAISAEKDGQPYLLDVGPGRQVYWEPAFPLPEGFTLHGVVSPSYDFGSTKEGVAKKYDCLVELNGRVIASFVNKPAPFEFVLDTNGMTAGGVKAGLKQILVATVISGRIRTKASITFVIGLPLPEKRAEVSQSTVRKLVEDAPAGQSPLVGATPAVTEPVKKTETTQPAIDVQMLVKVVTASVLEELKKNPQVLPQPTTLTTDQVRAIATEVVRAAIAELKSSTITTTEARSSTVTTPTLKQAQIWVEWKGTELKTATLSAKGKTVEVAVKPGLNKYFAGSGEEFEVQVFLGGQVLSGKVTRENRIVKLVFGQ